MNKFLKSIIIGSKSARFGEEKISCPYRESNSGSSSPLPCHCTGSGSCPIEAMCYQIQRTDETKRNWKYAGFSDDYRTKEKAKQSVMNSESLPQEFLAWRYGSTGRIVATRRPPWKQKLTRKQWNHGSVLRSSSHHASRNKKMRRLWSYLGKQIRYMCEHT